MLVQRSIACRRAPPITWPPAMGCRRTSHRRPIAVGIVVEMHLIIHCKYIFNDLSPSEPLATGGGGGQVAVGASAEAPGRSV